MPKRPPVYPSAVEYRPGRIQSLDAEQEVVLKQCWASLLKYWGYALDLSSEDIKSKNAYVVSSIVRESTNDGVATGSDSKKKRSFFSRKPALPLPAGKLSDVRAKELKENSRRYEENVAPSRDTVEVYTKHVEADEDSEDLDGCLEEDDASFASFQTASGSLEGTLIEVVMDRMPPKRVLKENNTAPRASFTKSQNALFPFLSKYDPSDIHNCLMGTLKNDLIDNFILRFVRARKNEHEDTMKMLVHSLDWRKHEVAVEQLLREGDATAVVTGEHPGFVKNFLVNKAFVRGQDRSKNPLFIFQSRKHFATDSSLAGTERYALLIVEWCRLFLREVNESVDLCSLVFDLSGFSMKNADNAPVKFLTSIFEAHYPESLGIVIVHNPPWIFSTVWNIIKNWLDPVVASKIHFTKHFDELKEFIAPEYIPEYLGGDDKKALEYHKPGPEHARPMKEKDEEYYRLKSEREQLLLQIIETTKKWVCCTDGEASSSYLKDKIYLSYQLSDTYIALDPYLRNPGVYDRDGTLKMKN